jgi:hypothetical protein
VNSIFLLSIHKSGQHKYGVYVQGLTYSTIRRCYKALREILHVGAAGLWWTSVGSLQYVKVWLRTASTADPIAWIPESASGVSDDVVDGMTSDWE